MTTSPPKDQPTQPTSPNDAPPSFGWTRYAEQINGRFAMIGFAALLVTEFLTRQDFFTWIGLR
ncbi:chlorophyll a/b-binding protein [Leptolyngbya sp. BC1307]|uniref:chlorophyll a/b-binding protein n=1 Tax=Leptolyngbya sp. BC1307 TaxID=2029589 RepID=UPI000EFD58B5|nr:chlorophyll a/b-binding protein [Leptolyngbya sp. BC1307]